MLDSILPCRIAAVFDRDAGVSVRQAILNEFLTGMLDGVFGQHAGLRF